MYNENENGSVETSAVPRGARQSESSDQREVETRDSRGGFFLIIIICLPAATAGPLKSAAGEGSNLIRLVLYGNYMVKIITQNSSRRRKLAMYNTKLLPVASSNWRSYTH